MPVNNTFVPDSSHPLPVYIDSSATINVVITAPIILDSSSSTTLTFLDSSNVAHAVSAANPLPVNASVSIPGSLTVIQPTGTNLHTVVDSGTITNITNPVHVLPDTSNVVVQGSVTVIQPIGSQLHIVLDTSNVNVVNTVTVSGTVGISGQVHTILDTSAVTVLGTIPVSIASPIHVLPDTSNVNVVNPIYVNGNVTVVQPTGSNLHVALDNSNVNVTNFPATQVVSGTVTVVQPTGSNLHVVQDTSVVIPASANAISTAVLEGNKVPLSVDLNSNLRTTSGVLPIQTVVWDNTTTQDTTSVLNVTGYGTVVIAFQPVNVTSGILTFEISDDGSIYYPISLIIKDAATINNPNIFNTWDFFLQGTSNNTLYANISGYRYFRVRLSQVIVGSAGVTVSINMQASSSSIAPITFVKQWTASELNATVYGASVDGGNTTTKLPVIVGRANAALPTWSEGKLSPISTDLKGRARVLIDSSSTTTVQQLTGTNLHVVVDNSASNITQRFGTPIPQTAAWTSGSSVPQTLSINTTGLGTVAVTYNPVGTITGGGVVFEVSDSDGTSWFSVGVTRQNQGLAFTTENSYTLDQIVENWQTNVSAYTMFRVRLTVAVVGSGTVNFHLSGSGSTSEPSVVVGQSNASLLNATVVGTVSGVDNTTNSVNKIPVLNSRANAAYPTWTEGNQVPLSVDTSGNLRVVTGPSQQGGVRPFHLVSAATTNATVIKPGAGQVYGWEINSTINGFRKICFHNTATTPVAGSNVFFTVALDSSARSSVSKPIGVFFSAGIGITTVTGHSDVDSSAVGLNDLDINIFYD